MRLWVVVAFAALLVLAGTSSASASTLSMDGGTLVLTATPGEANDVNLDIEENFGESPRFTVTDSAGITAVPPGCTADEEGSEFAVECPSPAGFRAALGDGDDRFNEFDPFAFPIDVDGAAGNDRLSGYVNIFVSAPPNAGSSTLRGGIGDDAVSGNAGNDLVLGEAGNDLVNGDGGDAPGRDVIDGGPGFDRIDQDWATSGVEPPAVVAVSLDGAANDGRAGEGDNVLGVESIINNAPGSYSGSDLDESWNVAASGAASVNGAGGADTIRTHRGRDTIDGGAGPDDIEGGYGDDTITGGPGRDLIVADDKDASCGFFSCEVPFGNDTVLARDGEIDSVTCGFGGDRVVADANDVVAGDCETVERAGATSVAKRCVVPRLKGKTLRKAKRALKKANCGLGKVRKARLRRKPGRVIKQSVKPGARRAAGTKVGVTVVRRR